jgi:hypothetical protein
LDRGGAGRRTIQERLVGWIEDKRAADVQRDELGQRDELAEERNPHTRRNATRTARIKPIKTTLRRNAVRAVRNTKIDRFKPY